MNRHEKRAAKATGASLDQGFEGYQKAAGKRLPSASNREVAEAYMRAEEHDAKIRQVGDSISDLSARPGLVRLEAQYGKATLSGTVEVTGIPHLAAQWASTLDLLAEKRPDLDRRATTRSAVVEGLVLNRQVTESGAATLTAALLWLTLDGVGATPLKPRLATGGVTVRYDIADAGPGAWNFRLQAFE